MEELKFENFKTMFLFIVHVKSSYFHEPRVGADTSGPGEAVSALR